MLAFVSGVLVFAIIFLLSIASKEGFKDFMKSTHGPVPEFMVLLFLIIVLVALFLVFPWSIESPIHDVAIDRYMRIFIAIVIVAAAICYVVVAIIMDKDMAIKKKIFYSVIVIVFSFLCASEFYIGHRLIPSPISLR